MERQFDEGCLDEQITRWLGLAESDCLPEMTEEQCERLDDWAIEHAHDICEVW